MVHRMRCDDHFPLTFVFHDRLRLPRKMIRYIKNGDTWTYFALSTTGSFLAHKLYINFLQFCLWYFIFDHYVSCFFFFSRKEWSRWLWSNVKKYERVEDCSAFCFLSFSLFFWFDSFLDTKKKTCTSICIFKSRVSFADQSFCYSIFSPMTTWNCQQQWAGLQRFQYISPLHNQYIWHLMKDLFWRCKKHIDIADIAR